MRSDPHSKAVQLQERTITGESVQSGAPVQRHYGSVWQKRRDLVLQHRGRICEVCGAVGADDGIRVHHLSYENFGNELDTDLLVVCRSCHNGIHAQERRAERDRELRELWQRIADEVSA